ncbi:MAG: threonine--tRNA ligase [Candidatus Aenigmarchaeota archaeon]|nr:threonine--tRNA ligase [Candidatus Aenigmarchaeota archaeon]
MKILLIHADFIEYEAKEKAIEQAEKLEKNFEKVDECLVVFVAVEKYDEKNVEQVVENLFDEINKVASQLNVKRIVLYPYAHLSSELASSEIAIKILKSAEDKLKEKYEVFRAPFGWYKSFQIKCKGHPLSELSREIRVEEVSEALRKEEKLKSEWYIIEPDGNLSKIELKEGNIIGFDFGSYRRLEKFARYEMAKSRKVEEEPPHTKLMRKLELVDYEPASDPGNLRYLPKGRLMKSLIEEYVTTKTKEYGAMEVETPIMYDYEHPALKDYLNRFPARQYKIQTPNKKVFLRFSACFGQFLLAKDMIISYKNLPIKLYELTKYSFRVEQRGELAGLRRLRAFTMPDCHAFCRDIDQAKEEIKKRFELAINLQEKFEIGKDYLELAIRVTKDFYENNKEFIKSFVKMWGKPALLEMWDKQFFYFIFKYELNFVDALDKAAALTTDQIDVENAKRYGIQFIDSDGTKKYPIILHLSPSGAVERVIYAILEKAYMEKRENKLPTIPFWLAPTQVRICCVSNNFIKDAEILSNELEKNKIRVDIDDRDLTIAKKIREAEMEWIPIIIVFGEKEKREFPNKLSVRIRTKQGDVIKEASLKEIIKYIKENTEEFPYNRLPLDKFLSRRPIFYSK